MNDVKPEQGPELTSELDGLQFERDRLLAKSEGALTEGDIGQATAAVQRFASVNARINNLTDEGGPPTATNIDPPAEP